jgi:hypothetical protein
MRVESPIKSSASGRKNSLSAILSLPKGYSAEQKCSEAVDFAGISACNRFSNAYSGFKP